MPSVIASFGELDRRLSAALDGVARAATRHPDLPALPAIREQLEALQRAAREGERLPPSLRDDLDFGALASRHLHPIDPALAGELYEIASFAIYAV